MDGWTKPNETEQAAVAILALFFSTNQPATQQKDNTANNTKATLQLTTPYITHSNSQKQYNKLLHFHGDTQLKRFVKRNAEKQ